MNSPLDRPVWHALTGAQAHLAQGTPPALRIDPGYGPFAAAAPGQEHALSGLLETHDDTVWTVEAEPFSAPEGLVALRKAALVQMVASNGATPNTGAADMPPMRLLGKGDAPAMAALAEATQPGPWAHGTWRYGDFFGIFVDGRLAAMAGERMRPAPGYAEVSGVAVWPEFRGRGWAAALIRRVMAGFAARGDIAFLHSYAENAGAIRLYESLGFRIRRPMTATVWGRAAS